jgi:hypothetical protein
VDSSGKSSIVEIDAGADVGAALNKLHLIKSGHFRFASLIRSGGGPMAQTPNRYMPAVTSH